MLRLSEASYLEARRSTFRRLSFEPELEAAFRGYLNERYRWPRVIFFAICSVSFLVAPLFNQWLFEVDADVQPLVLLIQLAWAFPVLGLAAWGAYALKDPRWLGAVSVAGNLTLWCSILAFHWLHLMGQMIYPLHVINFAVMAVAFFGGFRVRLLVLGGSMAIGLSVLAVLIFGLDQYPAKHFLYEAIYFWLIGIGGLVTIDLLNRESFLHQQRLKTISGMDPLTGLLNRRAFDLLSERALRQAARDQCLIAIAIVDLDFLKQINDRYGHLVGDDVLRVAGAALETMPGVQRPLDIRARFGGDEFVVTGYDLRPQEVRTLAEGILHAFRAVRFTSDDGEAFGITASVGIFAGVPHPGEAVTSYLNQADVLLYRAKREGRNRARAMIRQGQGEQAIEID